MTPVSGAAGIPALRGSAGRCRRGSSVRPIHRRPQSRGDAPTGPGLQLPTPASRSPSSAGVSLSVLRGRRGEAPSTLSPRTNFSRGPAGAPRPAGPSAGGSPPRRHRPGRQHSPAVPAVPLSPGSGSVRPKYRRPRPGSSRPCCASRSSAPLLRSPPLPSPLLLCSAPPLLRVAGAQPFVSVAAAARSVSGCSVLCPPVGQGNKGPPGATASGPSPPRPPARTVPARGWALGQRCPMFVGEGWQPPPRSSLHRTPLRQPGPCPRCRATWLWQTAGSETLGRFRLIRGSITLRITVITRVAIEAPPMPKDRGRFRAPLDGLDRAAASALLRPGACTPSQHSLLHPNLKDPVLIPAFLSYAVNGF